MSGGLMIKDINKEKRFLAGDCCSIAEVLHPAKMELPFDSYSLAHAVVMAHDSTRPHRLIKSTEVYFILSGGGTIYVNGEAAELKKGRAVVIPPGAVQYVENDRDEKLEFLCVVSPPWSAEDEVVC
ncbi:MAG: cupin domain-containing protein [Cloacibacillus sp.]